MIKLVPGKEYTVSFSEDCVMGELRGKFEREESHPEFLSQIDLYFSFGKLSFFESTYEPLHIEEV